MKQLKLSFTAYDVKFGVATYENSLTISTTAEHKTYTVIRKL